MDEMIAFKLARAEKERLRMLAVRRTWEEQRRVGNSEILREALALYMARYETDHKE